MSREKYSEMRPQYLPRRIGKPDLGTSIIQLAKEPSSQPFQTEREVPVSVRSTSRRKTPEIPAVSVMVEQNRGNSIVDVVAPAKGLETSSEEALRTETFESLVELTQDAKHVVEGIVPSKLMIHGRRVETISKERAALRLGTMGILRVNTGPDTVDTDNKIVKSRRELVLSGEQPGMKATTHSLDGATIADYGDFTRINFAPLKSEKGNYTARTSVDITPDGLQKVTTFTPIEGLNPLRKINADKLPPTISLPPEVANESDKPVTYSLKHANAHRIEDGVEIVLPATDHLSSLSVITLRITPEGVEKTVKVVAGGITYEANKAPNPDAPITEEVQEAVKLRKEVVADGVREVIAGNAPVEAPSLPYEGQGEIAKAELKATEDAEKEARKVRNNTDTPTPAPTTSQAA